MPGQSATKPLFQAPAPVQQMTLSDALKQAQNAPRVFVHADEERVIVGLNATQAAVVPVAEMEPWELNALKQIFLNDAIEKIGYDLKLTLRLLDLNLDGHFLNCFDGRLAKYLLDPSGDLSFSGCVAQYFSASSW